MADSNIVNVICIGKIIIIIFVSFIFPRRVISRCPAIMLAVSRTDSEIGRIILPVVSIIIIIGMIVDGVPLGRRCLNSSFVNFVHP